MQDYLSTTIEIKNSLVALDPTLTPVIDKVGDITVKLNRDYFASLVSTIIGQQLSNKVAGIIWQRLDDLFRGLLVPEQFLVTDSEALRSIGISYRKIEYIKNLASAVTNSDLNLQELERLSDQEVIDRLIKLKGIGVWTAEMFLIFSLGRPDVFSTGDLGLRKAVEKLCSLDERVNTEEIVRITNRWSPYRTFVSLHLWKFYS
ncbi:MAG: DNA-3-methyladenine glycosylase [Firmicutes bacterium]|nr:DNA-3-methyladenine glycosylase [Bacillota bacterium]